jgi:hypothetical protein
MMKNNTKFTIALLTLALLTITACQYTVVKTDPGADQVENQVTDQEAEVAQDSQDSNQDSSQEIDEEQQDPTLDLNFDRSVGFDYKNYSDEDLGLEFKYPSTFTLTTDEAVIDFGSFVWHKLTFEDDSGATLSIHINPDGFGPFFPDKKYTVEEGKSGELTITEVTDGDSEYSEDGQNFYMFSFNEASNGNNYLVMLSDPNETGDYQEVFEDFIESFTVL